MVESEQWFGLSHHVACLLSSIIETTNESTEEDEETKKKMKTWCENLSYTR